MEASGAVERQEGSPTAFARTGGPLLQHLPVDQVQALLPGDVPGRPGGPSAVHHHHDVAAVHRPAGDVELLQFRGPDGRAAQPLPAGACTGSPQSSEQIMPLHTGCSRAGVPRRWVPHERTVWRTQPTECAASAVQAGRSGASSQAPLQVRGQGKDVGPMPAPSP
ncbi:hypothetical protein SHJG_p202 (plasmid) [Streptomyces hygroscopicus subsp. jinggangensis 5008]|nr:hypothetical protein SHJG_p202 [Streptomyces hygroscopicus subsp. jinggangensis 5008]AGF68471.1 hypothetical protein SHJGH_p202 [Streptomyces hygroscopicus subsp. jinggangensis TL01]